MTDKNIRVIRRTTKPLFRRLGDDAELRAKLEALKHVRRRRRRRASP
jgi:hypothetical protein